MANDSDHEQGNSGGTEPTGGTPGQDWHLVARKSQKRLEWGREGTFDELRVDGWLHIEQMDYRNWYMMVGDARIAVRVGKDGRVTVDIERGFYGEILGTTGEAKIE